MAIIHTGIPTRNREPIFLGDEKSIFPSHRGVWDFREETDFPGIPGALAAVAEGNG